MNDRPRLDSWKEIARYLGRDVRTVIRWEQQRELPVYRVPGGKLSRVFAYPDEIDAWLARGGNAGDELRNGESDANGREDPDIAAAGQGSTERGPFAAFRTITRRLGVLAGAAIVAALLAAWTLVRETEPLDRLTIAANELRAIDASGRTQWTYRPDAGELMMPPPPRTHIRDLDDDGRPEVLAAVEVTRPPSNMYGGELVSFTADGRVRWARSADDRVVTRDSEYGPPWPASDLTAYRSAGRIRIAWTVHHFTWWPGLLITLDEEGRRVGTFVNAGWIRGTTPSLDGRYLFATGVSNSRNAYIVAVLDGDRPAGRSPEPPDSPFECLNCPNGDPVHYLVLPRTEVGRAHPFPGEGPTITTSPDGTVHIHALESGGPQIAAAIYELSPDLMIRSARFSDSYWEWHRRLERDGTIAHRAEECPERNGVEVQRWTPAGAWQTVDVPVR